MINANIKKAIVDAIGCENKAERKWLDAGSAVRAEYASREALEAVRPQFLAEVIYPALGDDANRIMNMEIPRRGSKDWNQNTPAIQQTWLNVLEARKTIRGKGSVYFGRIASYAFPEDKTGEPHAKRDLKTRLNEELAALIKAAQNAEAPPFDTGMVIGHLEAALKYVNK